MIRRNATNRSTRVNTHLWRKGPILRLISDAIGRYFAKRQPRTAAKEKKGNFDFPVVSVGPINATKQKGLRDRQNLPSLSVVLFAIATVSQTVIDIIPQFYPERGTAHKRKSRNQYLSLKKVSCFVTRSRDGD